MIRLPFKLFLLCLGLAALLLPLQSRAAEISLRIDTVSVNDEVRVTLTNEGRDRAEAVGLKLELAGRTYVESKDVLHPGQPHQFVFQVTPPSQPGSYPLYTTASYNNGQARLSALDAGYFNYQAEPRLGVECSLPDVRLAGRATVSIPAPPHYGLRFFHPPEIRATGSYKQGFGAVYTLLDTLPGFRSDYAMFAVYEGTQPDGLHATKICSARLITLGIKYSRLPWTPALFGLSALAALLLSLYLFARGVQSDRTRLHAALVRWSFSVATVSLLLYLYHTLYIVPEALLPLLKQHAHSGGLLTRYVYRGAQAVLNWLYFSGPNYDHFSRWAADALYLYMVFGNFFVLYYLVKPRPGSDKYWDLALTTFSLIPFARRLPALRAALAGRRFYWSDSTRIALLSLSVKSFYAPIFFSWTVNNIIHQSNLIQSFDFNFIAVNQFAVALLILIDVLIFSFAYITELPALKNQIKSVEPTLFGWAICLVCYPPFNTFAFTIVDYPLFPDWQGSGALVRQAAILATTLLWGIYVWASIALGFKASNLTNRGIVSSGPYRYLRHPAYVSKVGLWLVGSFFLGDMNFFFAVTLVAVYALRAWTEERHLSRDPDYLDYKKRVPWVIVPRVW